jgi:hypothetical protein
VSFRATPMASRGICGGGGHAGGQRIRQRSASHPRLRERHRGSNCTANLESRLCHLPTVPTARRRCVTYVPRTIRYLCPWPHATDNSSCFLPLILNPNADAVSADCRCRGPLPLKLSPTRLFGWVGGICVHPRDLRVVLGWAGGNSKFKIQNSKFKTENSELTSGG